MRTLLEIRSDDQRGFHRAKTLPALRWCLSVELMAKFTLATFWVVVIVVLDQVTKIVVDRNMALHSSIPIVDGIFNLTYIRNPGAAFGIFSGNHKAFRVPFLIAVSVAAVGFIVILLRRLPSGSTGLITALSFILGGAVGNLIDRVLYGEVIDFLDVYWRNYHWPAFNVADSFITVGVLITACHLLKSGGDDPFTKR